MNIYSSCFELIHQYIYGGVSLSSDMNLVCTLLATFACIFVFAFPFLVVFKIIKLVLGF